jgi:succinate dehydrogenase/fumarate reductase flavoprotein subunit
MSQGGGALSCDVAVVGAGLGGIAAAVRAAELGVSVVLLEAREELGGTALFSGGGVHIWGARTFDEYLARCPLAEGTLAPVLVESYPRFVDWLVRSGAPGSYGPSTLRGLTVTKFLIGRSIAPEGRIRFFRYLAKRLLGLGGTVMTGASVTDLLTDDGAVVGLIARQASAVRQVRAKTVVLAAGGFQANPQLLREQFGPAADEFVPRAVATDVGDGLRLARSTGAATSRSMDSLYGHLMPAPPCRIGWTNHVDPTVLSCFYAEYAIVVNVRGERFVDEGVGELNGETINASARQPPGGLWILFDQAIREAHVRYELPRNVLRPAGLRHLWLLRYMRPRWERGSLAVVLDSLAVARDRGATVLEAETLEALGKELGRHGVDREQAVATVRKFNDQAVKGAAAGLPVPKTVAAMPLLEPPFYAVKVAVGVSMTYGGVAIDERARALDSTARPVPGLYAVPGTAGGIHNLHYGGALAACGVFGMIAGEEAAAAAGRGAAQNFAVRPPSITNVAPVTREDSSEARKSAP